MRSSSTSRALPVRFERPVRHRDDPQALRGHGFLRFANLGRASRHRTGASPPSVRIRLHSGMTISGAPLQKERGALRRRMHRRQPHAADVEGNFIELFASRKRGEETLAPSRPARFPSDRRAAPSCPCCSPSLRSWHRRAVRKNGRYCAGTFRRTQAGIGRAIQSAPSQSRLTVIRFCVRVPVLSVQITVVEPSVSTDGR